MTGPDCDSAIPNRNISDDAVRALARKDPGTDCVVGTASASRHRDAGIPEPTLLWIDDQITRDSAVVQLLELEGYKVDCAMTGTAGLAMARTGQYHGILLDLRLPDIPGLAVLATLRADAINAPVLVLTGFGDTDSAFAARHFGADGFKCKPLIGDDLSMAVQQTLQRAQPVVGARVGDVLSAQERAHYSSIAALLEGLHRLSRNQATAVGSPAVDLRESVATTLARALAGSALPMHVFLACAAALRSTLNPDAVHNPWRDLAADAKDTILETLARPTVSDSHVSAALSMVEGAAARHRRLKLEDVAGAMTERIRPERLGALIQEQTGFWYTDWRTAVLIRPCLSLLLNTDDDVKQIVRRLLAFKNVAHFDHEFHRFLGLTPTRFREIMRSHPK